MSIRVCLLFALTWILCVPATEVNAKICESITDLLTGCSYIDTVVNSASPTEAIGQNSWITITGAGLSGSTREWNAGDFSKGGLGLPTQMDGVTVNINGKPAYVAYVSPGQINVISPADDALGPVMVEVRTNGALTGAMQVSLGKYDPALFRWPKQAVVATHADFTFAVSPDVFPGVPSSPAVPNETIILWGTGFGPTDPPFPNGELLAGRVFVVQEPVTVEFSGLGKVFTVPATSVALGGPGVYQIAVTVPSFSASGDVSVTAAIAGVRTFSTRLTINGSAAPPNCGQPGQPKC